MRYVRVGMSAGVVAGLPAITPRRAPVELVGSGIGGAAPLEDAATAYTEVLGLVTAGEVAIDVDAVPLADVARTWPLAGSDRRVVYVP